MFLFPYLYPAANHDESSSNKSSELHNKYDIEALRTSNQFVYNFLLKQHTIARTQKLISTISQYVA